MNEKANFRRCSNATTEKKLPSSTQPIGFAEAERLGRQPLERGDKKALTVAVPLSHLKSDQRQLATLATHIALGNINKICDEMHRLAKDAR
jgi:hypothetical protein